MTVVASGGCTWREQTNELFAVSRCGDDAGGAEGAEGDSRAIYCVHTGC